MGVDPLSPFTLTELRRIVKHLSSSPNLTGVLYLHRLPGVLTVYGLARAA